MPLDADKHERCYVLHDGSAAVTPHRRQVHLLSLHYRDFLLPSVYAYPGRPSAHINRISLLEFNSHQNAIFEAKLAAGDENAASMVPLLDFRNDCE